MLMRAASKPKKIQVGVESENVVITYIYIRIKRIYLNVYIRS